MASPPLPAAFTHVVDTRNLAADAALVESLPHLEPFPQAAALEILVRRAEPPFLAKVVGRFNGYGEVLQGLILTHVNDLSAGMRIALSSASPEYRAGAIDMIIRGATGRSAYLLADALRSRCPQTRELAAAALHRMTAQLLERLESDPPAAELVELNAEVKGLAEALASAVRRWESHLQPKVLEAALWLGDRVETAILPKLHDRRSKITRALIDLIEGASDPRLAGFMLRALAMPELRSSAARSISRAHNPEFLRAVLRQSWLLIDTEVERGCRWIQGGRWSQHAIDALLNLEDSAVAGAVNLLASVGGTYDRKIKRMGELLGTGHHEVRRAVVWRLVHDENEAATDLLTVVAARSGDGVSKMAARELRRRRGAVDGGTRTADHAAESSVEAASDTPFVQYWNRFDDLGTEDRLTAGELMRRSVEHLDVLLRAKLESADPLDQARALRIVRTLGLGKRLETSIYRLASARDAVVRSLAVSLLAGLPGATTERLLRAAVNDVDERVQADAVEALDDLDVKERVECTEPKLDSPNSRVRANAIKSLLRVDLRHAGEVLLDMLEAESPAHRLSALWVIERLRSPVVLDLVHELSRHDPDERVRKRAKRLCAGGPPENAGHPQSSDTADDALPFQVPGGPR